jgi:Cu2+-containing amine oxidase
VNYWTHNGAGTPEWDLAPCGTAAAHRRHVRRGEPVDHACRQANAAKVREWKLANPQAVAAQRKRERTGERS